MTNLEINKKIAKIKVLEIADDDGLYAPAVQVAKNPNSVFDYNPKNWAESISDAWELFLELPPGARWQRQSAFIGEDTEYWFWYAERDLCIELGAPTMPLAICNAWLKWKQL